MNALIPLRNVLEIDEPKQCLQHDFGSNQNPIKGGSRMAETRPNFILISRQGQPCNRGVRNLV